MAKVKKSTAARPVQGKAAKGATAKSKVRHDTTKNTTTARATKPKRKQMTQG